MTAVTVPSPPPGWYPDPDGAPATVRWWDGRSWSDVAVPVGPGVAVGTMPSDRVPAALPAPPAELFAGDGAEPGGRRTPWVLGAGVIVLVLLVVAAVLVGRSGAPEQVDTAAPSTPAGPSGPSSFPPGTVRIVDEASGISYPHLGDGWFEYDLTPKLETLAVAGQYFVTQEDPPSGGVYLAECTSGPVADGFGWAGPQSLRATALALAASSRANYYPTPHQERVLRDEPRTVDGHAAHLYEFQLSWDVPGYDASGERAAVLLVDVGRPVPALLYVSIPNTHAELYGVIDRVVEGAEVL